jgi:ABC-type lipoprotein release transport system permease subunit
MRTQALSLSVLGMLAGLTIGLAVAVAPVALVAANLLAIVPAQRASRAKPALVLRSE